MFSPYSRFSTPSCVHSHCSRIISVPVADLSSSDVLMTFFPICIGWHRAISLLENIAMGNVDYAHIVESEGGRKAIEELVSAYERDEEASDLVTTGKSALLSFDSVKIASKQKSKLRHRQMVSISSSNTDSSSGSSVEVDKAEMEKLAKQLSEYKNMLTAGQVFVARGAKGFRTNKMHVSFSRDFKTFHCKSPGSGLLHGRNIPARDIVRVGKGSICNPSRQKTGGLYQIFFEFRNKFLNLDLICRKEEVANRWLEASNCLIDIIQKYKQLLS